MKETLRQSIARLSADNLALREQNSVLTTDNQFLRTKLNEADIRARKLIAAHNRRGYQPSPEFAARKAAAIAEAQRTGKSAVA